MKRREFIKTTAAGLAGCCHGARGQDTAAAPDKPLRVALIGCGDRGCHAILPNVMTSGMAEMVAFIDPDGNAITRARGA